jgi:hypothetical protein
MAGRVLRRARLARAVAHALRPGKREALQGFLRGLQEGASARDLNSFQRALQRGAVGDRARSKQESSSSGSIYRKAGGSSGATSGLPVWWCPWVHDLGLLLAARRFGLGLGYDSTPPAPAEPPAEAAPARCTLRADKDLPFRSADVESHVRAVFLLGCTTGGIAAPGVATPAVTSSGALAIVATVAAAGVGVAGAGGGAAGAADAAALGGGADGEGEGVGGVGHGHSEGHGHGEGEGDGAIAAAVGGGVTTSSAPAAASSANANSTKECCACWQYVVAPPPRSVERARWK